MKKIPQLTVVNSFDRHLFVRDEQVMTNSREVAAVFEKNHKDVLRAIDDLGCSDEFGRRNFAPTDYIDDHNRKQPIMEITRDGAVFLIMGFTGDKAVQFKEAYIDAFNRMEQALLFQKVLPPAGDAQMLKYVEMAGKKNHYAMRVMEDCYGYKPLEVFKMRCPHCLIESPVEDINIQLAHSKLSH